MSFSHTYRELFSIRMLHDYFLDLGIVKFSGLEMSNEERERQLSLFDWSSYLDIQPTTDTHEKLKNQRMRIFRDKMSFKVLASVYSDTPDQPFITIAPDLQLNFTVRITDTRFSEYSAIHVDPGHIFRLTNKRLPLIPLFDTIENIPTIIDDEYLLNGHKTRILKKYYQVPPEASVIGIISVRMRVSDEAYSITRDDPGNSEIQLIKGTQFYMRFENSSYYWKYQRKDIPEHYLTEEKYPLVRNGFIKINPEDLDPPIPSGYVKEGMRLPNPQVGLFEKTEGEIYSVIYI